MCYDMDKNNFVFLKARCHAGNSKGLLTEREVCTVKYRTGFFYSTDWGFFIVRTGLLNIGLGFFYSTDRASLSNKVRYFRVQTEQASAMNCYYMAPSHFES